MVRPDDQSIADDTGLLRALTVDGWWKETAETVRPTSVAFFVFEEGEPGQTSCYTDTPQGREVFLRRFPTAHAAKFTAAHARSCGFNITRDPEGDDQLSPEHYVLTHSIEVKRGPYQRQCKQLAILSKFVTHQVLAVTPLQ
jgi:hypothetical protein